MRHVTDTGDGGQAERPSARLGARHPHRRIERGRPLVDLVEQRGEVAGEGVERSARRDDVDEPEERRPELGVARSEIDRLVVDRPDRMVGVRRERLRQRAADAPGLVL